MQAPIKSYFSQSSSGHSICVNEFDLVNYSEAQLAMSEFANARDEKSIDQIWFLQHHPIYTQGTACTQNTLSETHIPVIKSDRGGQITYHGPGQIVMYPLLRLKRYKLGVKSLVANLETAVINVLQDYGIQSHRRDSAPGVYIDQAKVAALGLRIKRGTSYHGMSLNVQMDLTPFANIDPCGLRGLEVTQLAAVIDQPDIKPVQKKLLKHFLFLI